MNQWKEKGVGKGTREGQAIKMKFLIFTLFLFMRTFSGLATNALVAVFVNNGNMAATANAFVVHK